jgi:hypothetical protein
MDPVDGEAFTDPVRMAFNAFHAMPRRKQPCTAMLVEQIGEQLPESGAAAACGCGSAPLVFASATINGRVVRQPDSDGVESTQQAYLIARKPA